MADTKAADQTFPVVQMHGLGPVAVVAIKLPDGTIALRHPSELIKNVAPMRAPGGVK